MKPSRRRLLKTLTSLGVGFGAGYLLSQIPRLSVSLPEYHVIRRESYVSPADIIIFKEGDYAIAVDGRTKEIIAKSIDHAEVIQKAVTEYGHVAIADDLDLGGELVTISRCPLKLTGYGYPKIINGTIEIKGASDSWLQKIKIKGIWFTSTSVIADYVVRLIVEDCIFDESQVGLRAYRLTQFEIVNLLLFNCGDYGIDLDGQGESDISLGTIRDIIVIKTQTNDGIRVRYGDGVKIRGIHATRNNRYGIYLENTKNSIISDSVVGDANGRGLHIYNCHECSIENIVATLNTVGVSLDTCKHITLSNIHSILSDQAGILVWNSEDIDIVNPIVLNNNRLEASAPSNAGIVIGGGSKDINIIGGKSGNDPDLTPQNQDYGVFITTDSEVNLLAGLKFKNNRVAPLNRFGWRRAFGNIGYVTVNDGVAVFSGDGTSTTFTVDVEHGLVTDDVSKIVVTVMPSKPCDVSYDLVDKDSDGFKETLRITLTFGTAPSDGEVIYVSWRAEVVS